MPTHKIGQLQSLKITWASLQSRYYRVTRGDTELHMGGGLLLSFLSEKFLNNIVWPPGPPGFTPGNHPWTSPLEITPGHHPWKSPLDITPGNHQIHIKRNPKSSIGRCHGTNQIDILEEANLSVCGFRCNLNNVLNGLYNSDDI